MNINETLTELKTRRLCTMLAKVLIALTWLGVVAIVALPAHGQDIYINDAYGVVPRSVVNAASWGFRERLGMLDLSIRGTTATACDPDSISVRYASIPEWLALFPATTTAFAITDDCDQSGRAMQIIWSPYKPMTAIGLQHEIGHALGCYSHLNLFTNNAMHAVGAAEILTAADVVCVLGGTDWPIGTVDQCFVSLGATWDMYVPGIEGLQVWLAYKGINTSTGQHTWQETTRRTSSLKCPGNDLRGNTVVFDDVRAYGLTSLTYARLRNVGAYWTLEAAR